MPKIRVNGVTLHYDDTGAGSSGETIVFSHGLLFNRHMFDEQIAAFKQTYRCISYDHRGQGESEVTASGYDMDTLTADALALITTLNAAPCHFVGLSMGGFVGMRLGARQPALLESLILLETSADPEPHENVGRYKLLSFVARWFGTRLLVGRIMAIMFGQKFLTDRDPKRMVIREKWKRHLLSLNTQAASHALMAVVNRQGIYDELDRITLPTLVMVGDADVATKPEKAQRIHERITGSELVMIPHAGHSASIEEPTFINAHITRFLQSQLNTA